MKLPALVLICLFCLSSPLSLAAPSSTPSTVDKKAAWAKKMQTLYTLLAETMTEASSSSRFSNAKNRARIQKNVDGLAQAARSLGHDSTDLDPTVRILAVLFANETQRAAQEFKRGNLEYSRSILQTVSSYCIACHTRNSQGPSFGTLPLEPNAQNLSALERGSFYAATRQYDRALSEFEKMLQDQNLAAQRPIEWERAVRYGLAIAVRVKNNPETALKITQAVLDSPHAPFFMKQDAETWKKTITQWKSETPPTLSTSSALLAEANRLMDLARQAQRYPLDRSADIQYLRASAVIHDLLGKPSDDETMSQAFLLAGSAYEVLRSLNLWELNEIYFEACIRRDPTAPIAQTCYERYEQSIYAGYSGSSGTHLPGEVAEHLKELRKLMQKQPPVQH